MLSAVYKTVSVMVAVPIFFGTWIYFVAEQGLFWGLAIGWLPAAIIAFVTCWLWPLALAAAAYGGVMILPKEIQDALGQVLGGAMAVLFCVWIVYAIVANAIVLGKRWRTAKRDAPKVQKL